MSEKSLYLEEDHVFEFREKRDLIQILNLKVITYYLLFPILSNRFLTLIIKRKKWEYVVGSSLTCRRKMQKSALKLQKSFDTIFQYQTSAF